MWKTIEGNEKYEVSDDGHVRNSRTKRILKDRFDANGYVQAYLYSEEGKAKNYHTHRLVADAFLEKDPIRDQVNHRDGNKLNNSVDNLEWCTKSENTRHAYENGLIKANMKPAIKAHTKIFEKDIPNIFRMRNNGTPIKEIASVYEVAPNTIYEILKRRNAS